MKNWQRASERFLKFNLRERRMLMLASSISVVWFFHFSVLGPLLINKERLEVQLKSNATQKTALDSELLVAQQQADRDPNDLLKQQIEHEQQKSKELLLQIRAVTGRYVSAEQMLVLLQDVLKTTPNVSLSSMTSKLPEEVRLNGETNTSVVLYRHSTVLVFTGEYTHLQALLARLHQLSWQLHWSRFRYEVKQHPKAQLTLELETISEQANFVRI